MRKQRGYTMVELVVVILVLGILAATAMPRFFGVSRFEEMGFTDATGSAARFAHKLAVASRCDTRIRIHAGGYELFQRATDCSTGAFTRSVSQGGGGSWAGNAPAGLAIGTLDLYFDAQGRPRDVSSDALYSSAQSVSIGSRTLTIEPVTGYVHGS